MIHKSTVGLFMFVFLIGISEVTAQVTSSSQDKFAGGIILSIDLITSNKKELLYKARLRNNSAKAVFLSTNPQHGCGGGGPYISLDRSDSSIVDIQWRVFDRDVIQSIACYKNNTGVELKRLEPGQDVEEKVAIVWPLAETVPPYFSRVHERRIERQNVRQLRFTVGYFVEDDGILEFLARKDFGWFVNGTEWLDTGLIRRKMLYEIQILVSSKVLIPETKA